MLRISGSRSARLYRSRSPARIVLRVAMPVTPFRSLLAWANGLKMLRRGEVFFHKSPLDCRTEL